MRILFLNFEFPPIGGGGANANAYLFREYAREDGLKIDCVTSTAGQVDEVIAFSDNITLYRLAVGKRDLHYWRQKEVLAWLFRARKKVNELLSIKSYDLCHAFFGFPSGAVSWLFRDRLPYLVSLRGTDVPGFNPRFSAQYVLLKPLFRKIWREAGAVVANSEGLRALAGTFAPELDVGVIPNGIDTQEFSPGPDERFASSTILCVSRLVARKGVQHLIEAMPVIREACPAVHLSIVGQGDMEPALRQKVEELGLEDAVVFHGYVSHEKLPSLYQRASLFVQPSYYEGMSNTVLEAMAAGLPIVATGEGGREELFDGNAVTCPYADPVALAGSISELLAQPGKMRAMGERSREIALGFSWENVARQYLDVYRQTLSAARRLG